MEMLHYCFYIPYHGEEDFLSLVFPIKCDYVVSNPFPIFHYILVFFQYTYEVVIMLFAVVIHSKVINY